MFGFGIGDWGDEEREMGRWGLGIGYW